MEQRDELPVEPIDSKDQEPDHGELYSEDDGYSIDTRVYIMQLASSKKDPVLAKQIRDVIMAYPHALDHMAHCIHLFNFNQTNHRHLPSSSSAAPTEDTTTPDPELDGDDTTHRDNTTKQRMTM